MEARRKVTYTLVVARLRRSQSTVVRVRTTHIRKLKQSVHELRRFLGVRRFEANFNASDLSALFIARVDIALYLHRECRTVIIIHNDTVTDEKIDDLIASLFAPCN